MNDASKCGSELWRVCVRDGKNHGKSRKPHILCKYRKNRPIWAEGVPCLPHAFLPQSSLFWKIFINKICLVCVGNLTKTKKILIYNKCIGLTELPAYQNPKIVWQLLETPKIWLYIGLGPSEKFERPHLLFLVQEKEVEHQYSL